MLFSQVTTPTSKWISDAQGSNAGIKMALLLFVGVTVEFDFVKYLLYMNLIRKAIFAQINRQGHWLAAKLIKAASD